ncbi:MAG: caspase family protein [Bacteroidota bacterium]
MKLKNMRWLLLFIFATSSFLSKTSAQNSPYQLAMEIIRPGQTSVSFTGGLLHDGDKIRMFLMNNPSFNAKLDDSLYYYIYNYIDVEGQSEKYLMFLNQAKYGFGDRFFNSKKNITLGSENFEFVIGDPFGKESFFLLISEKKLENPLGITQQDLFSLMKGKPTDEVKNCYLSSLSYESIGDTPPGFNSQVNNGKGNENDDKMVNEFKAVHIDEIIKDKDQLYTVVPIIQITNPPPQKETRGAKLIPQVHQKKYLLSGISSVKDGIEKVLINKEEATLYNNTYWEKEVVLLDGLNTFVIQAISRSGSSGKDTIRLISEGDEVISEIKSRNFLLAIGVDDYTFWPKLTRPAKDVKAVGGVLLDRYQFSNDNVQILLNQDVTVEKIDKAFRTLITQVTNEDNVLIYYAGHGYYDKILEEGYWIPAGAKTNSTSEYLPNSTIGKYIKALKSRHTLVISDACFSGSLYVQDSRGTKDAFADNIGKFKSRWAFSSGRLEEVADGMAGSENSPFATYILKFLKQNTKDYFAVSEMVQFVKTAVANNSNQTPFAAPLRDVGDEGGEFIFRLKQ